MTPTGATMRRLGARIVDAALWAIVGGAGWVITINLAEWFGFADGLDMGVWGLIPRAMILGAAVSFIPGVPTIESILRHDD